MTAAVKDELHRLVDHLADAEAVEVLDYLRWLVSDDEVLSDDDLSQIRQGEEEIARGEYVTLRDLHRSLGG